MEPKLRNPHQRALITTGGLVLLALVATILSAGLAVAGLANPALAWIGLVVFSIVGLMWLSIWLLGFLQVQRAAAFLASERPRVRWSYSPSEWQQFKEVIWQEEQGDWKVQWGCLTILLALPGLLAGAMIGLEEGLLEAAVNGLLGMLFGGLAGFVIGALVAGGNYWGARQAYRQSDPGQVALGPGEIYANTAYFRADGMKWFIRAAELQRGNPTTLVVQLIFPPRPRMPLEEEWVVPVPAGCIAEVENLLPLLVSRPEDSS